MTLSAYKFLVRKREYLETPISYTDFYLDNIIRAFTTASPNWTQVSSKETVGNPSSTYFALRTAQLFSSASNEYLRIWALNPQDENSYNGRMYVSDSPTTNPSSGDNLYVYKGNLMKFTYTQSNNYWSIYSGPVYFFGISDNPIGADMGQDLGLKLPLFSMFFSYSSSSYFNMSGGSTAREISAFTVQTDGSMFSITAKRYPGYNGSYYGYNCIYAPDLIVCANKDDAYSNGVVCCFSNASSFTFQFDTNNTTSPGVARIYCSKADGSFDYIDSYPPTYYINTKPASSSKLLSKLVCIPAEVYITPITQAGSTLDLIKEGVGFKGWINMKYLKFGSEATLLDTYGTLYQGGDFIYMGQQTLMCWNASNPNPFI